MLVQNLFPIHLVIFFCASYTKSHTTFDLCRFIQVPVALVRCVLLIQRMILYFLSSTGLGTGNGYITYLCTG